MGGFEEASYMYNVTYRLAPTIGENHFDPYRTSEP